LPPNRSPRGGSRKGKSVNQNLRHPLPASHKLLVHTEQAIHHGERPASVIFPEEFRGRDRLVFIAQKRLPPPLSQCRRCLAYLLHRFTPRRWQALEESRKDGTNVMALWRLDADKAQCPFKISSTISWLSLTTSAQATDAIGASRAFLLACARRR